MEKFDGTIVQTRNVSSSILTVKSFLRILNSLSGLAGSIFQPMSSYIILVIWQLSAFTHDDFVQWKMLKPERRFLIDDIVTGTKLHGGVPLSCAMMLQPKIKFKGFVQG